MERNVALSRLDSIAQEIRIKSERLAMDMIDVGKSLAEAKSLCPHGEWGAWLQNNTDFSERTAQNAIAAYVKFGGNEQIKGIGWSKIVALTGLPDGSEGQFLAEHDVAGMGTRALADAVRSARNAANGATEQAKATPAGDSLADELRAQLEAEKKKTAELEAQKAELVEDLQKGDFAHGQEIARMKKEIDMLNDQVQSNLSAALDGQSATIHADFGTNEKRMDASSYSIGVAGFINEFASLPYDRAMFAGMGYADKAVFVNETERLIGWLQKVLAAARTEAMDA